MKQTEVIARLNRELKEAKIELDMQEQALARDEAYQNTKQAILSYQKKRAVLYERKNLMERKLDRMFSGGKVPFISAYADFDDDLVRSIISELDPNLGDAWGDERKVRDMLWEMLQQLRAETTRVIDAEIQIVWNHQCAINTEDYNTKEKMLVKAQNRVKEIESQITYLSEMAYFRQWAKNAKAREERAEHDRRNAERKNEITNSKTLVNFVAGAKARAKELSEGAN